MTGDVNGSTQHTSLASDIELEQSLEEPDTSQMVTGRLPIDYVVNIRLLNLSNTLLRKICYLE